MNLDLFEKLADDQNKLIKILVVISILVIQIVFSFFIAEFFGYTYNGDELNFKNIVMFFSSYQILIPFFAFLIVFLLMQLFYPFILHLWLYKKFKDIMYDPIKIKKFINAFGLLESEKKYESIKDNYKYVYTKEGVSNVLNQAILLFSICLTLASTLVLYAYWSIILMVIMILILLLMIVVTYFHALGYITIRFFYLYKRDIKKIIKDEHNRNIGEVSERN